MSSNANDQDAKLVQVVREAYSTIAKTDHNEAYSVRVANAFGYTADEIKTAPSESHMGLACGNPVANASIKEGETVLDLGSGGGFDVFLAARKVGKTGQAIGLDGSDDMVAKARQNATKQGFSPPHVAFVAAQLTEPLPIATSSVDCVLSNCVINLLPPPGKLHIFREIFRVLKPGGRLALSDIVAKKSLPDQIRDDLALYVGCISGAIQLHEYKGLLEQAGLEDATFVATGSDLNVYFTEKTEEPACCGTAPPPSSTVPEASFDANEWAGKYLQIKKIGALLMMSVEIASYHIYAVKPDDSSDITQPTPSVLLRWWDAYPPARCSPDLMSPSTLAEMIRIAELRSGHGYLVVDVRGEDHAGGHVIGSVQWRAQSFYDNLPAFLSAYGHIPKVIFYCGRSNGRGPRCAGWYQDYLEAQSITTSQAFVLEGGIVRWKSDPSTQDLVEFDTASED
ncbi:NAD(P)-binding protein [Sistotremastrum niveocremeum HHB9708]|uniref:Arsenite methyltransferase n=1 Tax=Sistotremastrum niveocremeum HHB9708 TaxID=1314777 RepID=A0A164WP97_9AGAM|nr:NAD(P)-binding protein [Sistotremastrum niveocremeum HHB9708]